MSYRKMLNDKEELTPGQLWQDGDLSVWIVPEQSDFHHLEFCVVNLFTGKVIHFSRLKEPVKEVYGWEVMW